MDPCQLPDLDPSNPAMALPERCRRRARVRQSAQTRLHADPRACAAATMLLFWVFVATVTLLVTVVLVMPLLRRRPPGIAQAEDAEQRRLDVYRDRRREIERERASGRLDPSEADHAQEDLLRQLATDLPLALRSADRHEPGRMHGLPVTAALALVALV